MPNESPINRHGSEPKPGESPSRRTLVYVMVWGILCGLAVILPVEYRRLREAIHSDAGWLIWLTEFEPDTTLPLIVFLFLPFAWVFQRGGTANKGLLSNSLETWLGGKTKPSELTKPLDLLRVVVLAGLVAGVSVLLSVHIGSTSVEIRTPKGKEVEALSTLPPAFHDEYSYIFQAKTFLAGRLSFKSHPRYASLFDQMHVLNDKGVYASRYFPGTGLWMAPFVAVKKPHWGHWLAGALSAVCILFAGRELAGNAVGLLAGLLTAISPGIQLFGQLLLAHHPTLFGLTFFAWMFFRMMRTRSHFSAALAGLGLAFAMVCRPMTAAGIGLPFGFWLIYWWFCGNATRSKKDQSRWNIFRRSLLVGSLGLPLIISIGGMLVYNSYLTGKVHVTPYQLYTDIYTPRHVYGFNNVERAASNTSAKVITNYDQWAENLTASLALQNAKLRIVASGQWVLGIVPLVISIGVFPFLAGRSASAPSLSDSRWWLVFCSMVSLHLAHIPYWFSGIRHWHYVFEAAPFLLLIFAGVFVFFLQRFWEHGFNGIVIWWMALLVASLWVSYGSLPGDDSPSRVQRALQEDIWAKRNYAVFNRMLDRTLKVKPALLLIAENPSDRHIDYVTNSPSLDAPVIRGRFRPEATRLDLVIESFSDRAVYVLVLNPKVLSDIESGLYTEVDFERIVEEPIIGGTAVVYRLHLKQIN